MVYPGVAGYQDVMEKGGGYLLLTHQSQSAFMHAQFDSVSSVIMLKLVQRTEGGCPF